jgi:hypothetical protein
VLRWCIRARAASWIKVWSTTEATGSISSPCPVLRRVGFVSPCVVSAFRVLAADPLRAVDHRQCVPQLRNHSLGGCGSEDPAPRVARRRICILYEPVPLVWSVRKANSTTSRAVTATVREETVLFSLCCYFSHPSATFQYSFKLELDWSYLMFRCQIFKV